MTEKRAKEIYTFLEKTIKPTDKVVMWRRPYKAALLASGQEYPHHKSKPSPALWYACGLAWIDWCISESPSWVTEHIYKITVNHSKVLHLTTAKAILAFSRQYVDKGKASYGTMAIKWASLKEEYTGIEICPYQWDLRFDKRAEWYYTWDVASGAIWDKSAILDIKQVKLP